MSLFGWLFKGQKSEELSPQDLMFSKDAVHEGLRALGNALNPKREDEKAALHIGYDAVHDGGLQYATAVSIIALGVAENYLHNKNKSPAGAVKLMDNINSLVAEEFNLDPTELWDLRGSTISNNKNAGFVFAKASVHGFRISLETKESPFLGRILLATAKGDSSLQV